MPRLSVLVPVRNGAGTVRRAIDSALRVMPRDSELLVFDDASDDGTPAVLGRIDDRRLRVIRSEQPLGVAGGLNRLLEHSDSEFVGRMDADDVCVPARFRRQLSAVRTMDVVFTTVVEWTPGSRLKPNAPIALAPDVFPYHLLLTNPVAHPTMLARRHAIEAVGGYRAVPAEDYDLWIRLALTGAKLGRLAAPGLIYRVHGGQVTSSESWRLSSWRNPLVAEAFGDLSGRLLGRRFPRLTTLAVDDSITRAEFDVALTRFAGAVTEASAALRTIDRRRLLKTLMERVGAVRAIRAAL
ncbi:hypothetical protein GCM10027416_08190 [Okibacterium endophyticum]